MAFVICLPGRMNAASSPTVSYTQDFPGSDPQHYVITVSSDGHASYQSDGKLATQDQAADQERFEFPLPMATTQKIFDFAKRVHYFAGALDSKKKVASTGEKTLMYDDGAKQTKATYNYSTVAAVQSLTRLFQGLSSTLEFGRRLQYDYRHQKLALNEELLRMNDALSSGQITDVSPVSAILDTIAKDHTVINVARARAMRLAAKGN
jgi:hypothetical protein